MINPPCLNPQYYIEVMLPTNMNGVHSYMVETDETIEYIPEIGYPSEIKQFTVEERLKSYTDEIKRIIGALDDPRKEYEMKRFVEIELADTLGIYISHYKSGQTRQIGYMPSQ